MAKTRRKPPEELMRALDQAQAESTSDRIRQLVHELQVHSEEIHVQNEQLIKAQHELEQARDRYAELYDLAPIGYVTLDAQGMISDINIIGAQLLGRSRSYLAGVPIFTQIDEHQRANLRNFLANCSQEGLGTVPQVEVHTTREQRWIRLVARSVMAHGGQVRYFMAMFDVTEERRLADQNAAAAAVVRARAADLAKEVVERQAAEERGKMLLDRLVTIQEEERRRIARNLHDHLGQQLTALRLTVGSLKDGQFSEDQLRDRVNAIDAIVAQIDRDVDVLAWDLRPVALDDMGLEAALAEFLRQWSLAQNVPAHLHVAAPTEIRLPPEIESHLYRVVQEALNNISKHAAASCVDVMIDRRPDYLIVSIEDDGRGFNPETQSHSRGRHSGMGLIGMQERAALIGGEVQIESTPGDGTTVLVRIPLKN